MFAGDQADLFALVAGQTAPVRLTDDPANDRDPAWSPDGQHIAFASHRDGNWELYILDIQTGTIRRLTNDPAFDAGPTWSPDGQWIAYERYIDGNLDVYLMKADGSEGPYRVTRHPAPDFQPQWTAAPEGRSIVYVSLRDGNPDIYLLSLDDPNEDRAINLTSTPAIDEGQPAWSPDGRMIAYSARENGLSLIYTRSVVDITAEPVVIGQGTSPAWSPDGSNLVFISPRASSGSGSLMLSGQLGAWESSVQAFALASVASSPDWTAASLPSVLQGSLAFAATAALPTPYFEPVLPQEGQEAPYRLINLTGVIADLAYLSDRVDGSFMALRDRVNREAGWDFLGRLDHVWWALDRPVQPGEEVYNWHKAGRAIDIVQAYNQGDPAQIELVMEQIGADTYWRLFVRAAVQDGSLGEPLRSLPWDFGARASGDVRAYESGGRPKQSVPPGYYVDFTQLAELYGWDRTPSDETWRYNWPGVLYWQYEKRDGLDWWTAMSELYPPGALEQSFYTPTPAPRLEPTAIPTLGGTPGATSSPTVASTPATSTPMPSSRE